MSDYMFMLETHLSSNQSRAVQEVQSAAAQAGISLFLTGGAVRDMMGGFPIRDLDFTVEANAIKLAKSIANSSGATIVAIDENRKTVELLFQGGVPAEIGMARQEKYARAGSRPQVSPATIHEDLRGRDFTVNAIALSLNRASRGLLLDPMNGLGDLQAKELRAVTHHTLYDRPGRLLRLIRLKVRLGYQIAERTRQQFLSARETGVEKQISGAYLQRELRQFATEPNPADLLQTFEQEQLLALFSPSLAGARLNLAGFAKLQKAKQLAPFGVDLKTDEFSLFLAILTEKLTPKERQALMDTVGLDRAGTDVWHKLDARSAKLEKELLAANLQKPSRVYQSLVRIPGEQMLYLLVHPAQRLAQDRIRNYLQKYLPAAQEVSDAEVEAAGGSPGTPRFEKKKLELISKKLDARPKRIVVPEPVLAAPAAMVSSGRK